VEAACKGVLIIYQPLKTLFSLLYRTTTWSLTLREERILRVFENRVLRRIFRPKKDEVTGEWRKLHNEELRDLCSSKLKKLNSMV
jgi:hypothetical protein